MTEPPIELERLRRRRREKASAIRRRRRRALGALLLLLAAAAAVVIDRSGGSASSSTARANAARTPPAKHHGHSSRSGGAAPRDISRGPQPAREVAVPVLMYHVIAPPPAGAPFPGLYVPAEEFRRQMLALAAAGWHAVTLDELRAHWLRGTPLGRGRPIVITFDNGYQSQYKQALPVLRRLGWVGVENIQLSGLPPSEGGLSEEQVRGMIAAGWELDTQGISHADLPSLSAAELRRQVLDARVELQRRYHVPVNWFCYPSGHYDAAVLEQVKSAGFVGSTTVVPGWASPGEDPYRMHRLRVLGGTSAQGLLALIAGSRQDGAAPPSYGE